MTFTMWSTRFGPVWNLSVWFDEKPNAEPVWSPDFNH